MERIVQRLRDRWLEDDRTELKVFRHCENCGEELVEGYEALELDGFYYCDEFCLAKALGARTVYGE